MNQEKIKDDFRELEKITKQLEDQEVGLEESLKLFEKGSVIIKKCHKQLKEAKNKFEEIKEGLEEEINEK